MSAYSRLLPGARLQRSAGVIEYRSLGERVCSDHSEGTITLAKLGGVLVLGYRRPIMSSPKANPTVTFWSGNLLIELTVNAAEKAFDGSTGSDCVTVTAGT